MWFIQGNKFNDWRENSSLLWISGNRTFSPCQPLCDWWLLVSFLFFSAGSGKSILWYAVSQRF